MKTAVFAAVMLFPLCLNSYAQLRPAKIEKRVAALIEQMLDVKTEQRAFAELETLGCSAVPAIIDQMEDRRDLPDPRMSLRNKSPQAFEELRHYGPKKVVDALAAILNQITGQHFGFIYNGATDAERANTVRGWRDFLRRTPAAKLCEASQVISRGAISRDE